MDFLDEILDSFKGNVRFHAVQEDYARLVNDYEVRWAKFLKMSREWVLKNWPEDLPEDGNLVDMGCGTGAFIEQLHEKYPSLRLLGIDGSFDMLDQARARDIPAKWAQLDLDSVDLSETVYDVVLSMHVLHHLDDPVYHLAQLKALAGENGTVFFCDFAIDTPYIKAAEYYWRGFRGSHNKAFSSAEMKQMLAGAGLKIKAHEILKPDGFWHIQIYKLQA